MTNNNSSIKCLECGGDNPESAGFCSNCGVKLEPVTPSNNCPSCGAEVGENAKFCSECGETLASKPVTEETIETSEDSSIASKEPIETSEESVPTEDKEIIETSEEIQLTAPEDVEKSDDNICPNCGHQNPPKTIFCKNCGKSLRKSKSPKSIPKREIPPKQDNIPQDRPIMAPKRKILPMQDNVSEDSSTTSPTRKIPPKQGKSYKTMPNVAKERRMPPRSNSKPHKSSGLGGIFGNKSKLIKEIDKTLGSIEEKAQPHIKNIDNKIQDIQNPKKDDLGYLICESCNNQYKLKPGESPDDFAECSCGGKLRFSRTSN